MVFDSLIASIINESFDFNCLRFTFPLTKLSYSLICFSNLSICLLVNVVFFLFAFSLASELLLLLLLFDGVFISSKSLPSPLPLFSSSEDCFKSLLESNWFKLLSVFSKLFDFFITYFI